MEPIPVLHEEKHFAVVVKPTGVLSQSAQTTAGGAPDMIELLKARLHSVIYPVHRLDRETAGVMLYAKTKKGAAALSSLAADGALEKHYLAVVHGAPEPECGELRDLLFHDVKKNKSYVVTRQRAGVKEARLAYERLAVAELDGESVSLVRVRLYTGRTHQIRVQFSSRRMPLVGDNRYGSRAGGELALFAESLAFVHPFSGERVAFSAKPENERFKTFGTIAVGGK